MEITILMAMMMMKKSTLQSAQSDEYQKMDFLLGETIGKALLDSGYSKTVCGEPWLHSYLDNLTTAEKEKFTF